MTREPEDMPAQPSGMVAFLFTDLEGSTALWERSAAAMRDALAEHDRILRVEIEDRAGYVFTTAGDSFAAAFHTVDDATAAAVAIQRRVGSHRFSGDIPIRVRIGIHVGTADERDGDYFGRAPTRAARVMGAAYGSQILVSAAARAQLGEHEARELGPIRLSGLDEPEIVSQILAHGIEDDFGPLRAAELQSSLPPINGSLFGRQDLVAQVLEDLRSDTRLVSLVGPGGVGKTRLALDVGHRLSAELPATFVDLTALANESQLTAALAGLLGVRGEDGRELEERIVDVLDSAPRLVILDNCEHVIDDAAAFIEHILASTSSCRVLVTSREVLDLPGEQVRSVPPLPMGAGGSAVELFLDLLLRAGVDPDQLDGAELVEIVERLDGLPLALELAAARCATLSTGEVLGGLTDRFQLLARRRGRGLGHHRSLEATLDWSWDLLDDDEQRALRDLSVFASSWSVTSMATVLGIGTSQAVDLIDRLAAKSLIVRQSGAQGLRTAMLESVRAYARDRAAEAGSDSDLRVAHLDWIDALTEDVADQIRLLGSGSGAMADLDEELDEIRSALDRCLLIDPERGLDIATRVWEWWRSRMPITLEGAERIDALLERADVDVRSRVGAHAARADLLRLVPGKADEADRAVAQARQGLAEVDDRSVANQLELRILIAQFDLDDPSMPDRFEALAAAAEEEATTEDAMALHLKALWTLGRGTAEDLAALAPRVVTAAERSGNAASIAHSHELRAFVAVQEEDQDGAREHLADALDGLEATHQLGCVLHAMESIAWWALRQEDSAPGLDLLADVLGLRLLLARNSTAFEAATIERILDDIGELPEPSQTPDLDGAIARARQLVDGSARDPERS